ncbi:hypothetical protein ACE38W_15540 [Chitinophaga sp. Hz27]|uniref:hypothetical protein n=1 Tax=Chitinophaga sp. Hz27 TaxID=3347169 RepID=UPI0035DCB6AB
MILYKEALRHAGTTTTKETFFNSQKKTIAILDTFRDHTVNSHSGELSVYDYSGDSYLLRKYKETTETYKRFKKEGPAVLALPDWQQVKETHYKKECKYDKGLLLEELTHNIAHDEQQSVSYQYDKGLKIVEKRVLADGTKITINYVNDSNGHLLSKSTFKNDVVTDLINYSYQENGLLSLEQTFHLHNGQRFLAAEKQYAYNAENRLEKTAYYGRYNGQLYLYKTEEEIRKDNKLTKKSAGISSLDIAIGYYDLAALHRYFKDNNMEGYIPYYDKDFAAKGLFTTFNYTVEQLDQQGNPVETHVMNPEKPELVLTRVTYRNEYNEADLMEFVITYILNDKSQLEENSIRKFYYKED